MTKLIENITLSGAVLRGNNPFHTGWLYALFGIEQKNYFALQADQDGFDVGYVTCIETGREYAAEILPKLIDENQVIVELDYERVAPHH